MLLGHQDCWAFLQKQFIFALVRGEARKNRSMHHSLKGIAGPRRFE
jgi:hypothetical protein